MSVRTSCQTEKGDGKAAHWQLAWPNAICSAMGIWQGSTLPGASARHAIKTCGGAKTTAGTTSSRTTAASLGVMSRECIGTDCIMLEAIRQRLIPGFLSQQARRIGEYSQVRQGLCRGGQDRWEKTERGQR